MCTVSWWRRDGRLSLRFNRDEQKNRPASDVPENREGLIWPRDPVGGGTWIAVDGKGTIHCVLNYYDAETPCPNPYPKSRGTLPLFSARSELPLISGVDPEPYSPFHLLRVPRVGRVEHVCWDSRRLVEGPAHAEITHWTTSGWNSAVVVRARGELFKQMLDREGISEEMLHDFHTKQDPVDSGLWPLMSRPDARTVSLSEIRVDASGIRFNYSPVSDQGMLEPHELFQNF